MRFAVAAVLAWAVLALFAVPPAHAADDSPIGLWLTIDDNSGKARSQVRIYEQDGALFGKIEKIIIPGKTDRCVLCTGERRDQLALGLVIMRQMERAPGAPNQWAGGDILDPEKGTVYSSRLTLAEDGQSLQVRGFIGISLFGRTQIWTRVKP